MVLFKNVAIEAEFMSTEEGAVIRNKIIGGRGVKYAYLNNIYCTIHSYEFPFLLKSYFPISKNLRLQLYTGASYSLGFKDISSIERERFLFEVNDSDEWDNLYQSFIKRNKTKLQKYRYYFKGI